MVFLGCSLNWCPTLVGLHFFLYHLSLWLSIICCTQSVCIIAFYSLALVGMLSRVGLIVLFMRIKFICSLLLLVGMSFSVGIILISPTLVVGIALLFSTFCGGITCVYFFLVGYSLVHTAPPLWLAGKLFCLIAFLLVANLCSENLLASKLCVAFCSVSVSFLEVVRSYWLHRCLLIFDTVSSFWSLLCLACVFWLHFRSVSFC